MSQNFILLNPLFKHFYILLSQATDLFVFHEVLLMFLHTFMASSEKMQEAIWLVNLPSRDGVTNSVSINSCTKGDKTVKQ